jgi:rhodanese-related sulfurtransferase
MLLIMVFFAVQPFPVSGGGFSAVTSSELKAMIDRNEPGLVVIDSRSLSQYEETHIKGAISIPLAEMEQNPALPTASKDVRLVFYCSGTT